MKLEANACLYSLLQEPFCSRKKKKTAIWSKRICLHMQDTNRKITEKSKKCETKRKENNKMNCTCHLDCEMMKDYNEGEHTNKMRRAIRNK